MTNISPLLRPTASKPRIRSCLLVAGLCAGIAILMFLMNLLRYNGILVLYGDYVAQQMPFYQMAHDAARSGQFGWSWLTDSGSSFVGSYAFYLLGSPFFWLTVPFPSEAVAYLMGPLYVLKIALCGLTAYLYLKRFVRTDSFAVAGGLLYAFCGFNLFNTVFNHFHDAVCLFPLLLLALEKLVVDKRPYFFAVMVAIAAFTNYFFFAGEVVFLVLYFAFRLTDPAFRKCISVKTVLSVGTESVFGSLCAAALMLPAALALTGNDRIEQGWQGLSALFFSDWTTYLGIIKSMFLPPDAFGQQVLASNLGTQFSSLSLFLPLCSLVAFSALFFVRGKALRWIKWLILACGCMMFVPILNSAFFLFRTQYYARWFFMPILIIILGSMIAMERKSAVFWPGVTINIVCVLALLACGLIGGPHVDEGSQTQLVSLVAISLFGLGLYIYYLLYWRNHPVLRTTGFVALVAICCCICSVFYVAMSSNTALNPKMNQIHINAMTKGECPLPKDEGFYRMDVSCEIGAVLNYGMVWKIPSTQAFQSVVPNSVSDFYTAMTEAPRFSSTLYDLDRYGIRGLLSTKYMCVFDDDMIYAGYNELEEKYLNQIKESKYVSRAEAELFLKQHGYEMVDGGESLEGLHLWKNTNFIPVGFSYEHYVTESTLMKVPKEERDLLMLKAMVVKDEDESLVSGLLTPLSECTDFSYESYIEDCQMRAASSSEQFIVTEDGFADEVDGNRRIVFYSVPFDAGWSASVDGQAVDIVQSNVGYMSICVPAGKHHVEFTYATPGVTVGVIGSFVGVSGLVLYAVLLPLLKKRRKAKGGMNCGK